MTRLYPALLCAVLASACTSTGTLGIVSRSNGTASALKNGTSFEEIGPAHGSSCRFFVLGVAPFGDGTVSDAAQDALDKNGGDALVNVTVETSLYGFLPIYQLLSYTCTRVSGTAVKFDSYATASR